MSKYKFDFMTFNDGDRETDLVGSQKIFSYDEFLEKCMAWLREYDYCGFSEDVTIEEISDKVYDAHIRYYPAGKEEILDGEPCYAFCEEARGARKVWVLGID